MSVYSITVCMYVCMYVQYNGTVGFSLIFSRICLVGEKPDKELPGILIVGERGDTVYTVPAR